MKRLILLLFVFAYTLFAQNNIEQIRNVIEEINIGFLDSSKPSINQINKLENLLNSSDNKNIELNRTQNLLHQFNASLKNEIIVDSLKKLFRGVNNQFNADTGNYFYDEILKSNKQKILVLSTSMSCECTLEMCYLQETQIQKFCLENDYGYAVIDTWTNPDIQDKYKAGFVPTVIFLDSNNFEIQRFSREDNLLTKINKNLNY